MAEARHSPCCVRILMGRLVSKLVLLAREQLRLLVNKDNNYMCQQKLDVCRASLHSDRLVLNIMLIELKPIQLVPRDGQYSLIENGRM